MSDVLDKLRAKVQEEDKKVSEAFAELAFKTFKRNRSMAKAINPEFGRAFGDIHNLVLSEMTGEKLETISQVYRLWREYGDKRKLQKNQQKIVDKITEAEEEIGNNSELTSSLFRGWVNGKIPEKLSIVKYAIACKIDLLTTATILRAGGYQFNISSDKEYAWAYLIMFCSGKSMSYCNEKLKGLGFTKKDSPDVFLNKRVIKFKSERKPL